MASGLGEAFVSDALSALAGRWVVLVGDSSVRMVYHFLIQFLSGEWETFFIEERVPVSTATVNERNQAAVEAQVCFFLLRTVLRA